MWSKEYSKIRNPMLRRELGEIFTGEESIAVAIPKTTPVNAVASTLTLAAADLAVLSAGDTFLFDGNVFVKAASATEDNEFEDTAGLAALIDALDDWGAVVDSTTIVITAATKGASYDDTIGLYSIVSDSTAGGDESTAATATVPAADLAQLDAGDTVTFDGVTFTKVASDAGDGEFTDTAGLILLLDALDDWGAEASGSDIVITAAADGAEGNDYDVVIALTRVTANGVTGTPGYVGQIVYDASYIHVCTVANETWKKATLS